jgi:hypothetical protein
VAAYGGLLQAKSRRYAWNTSGVSPLVCGHSEGQATGRINSP